MKSGNFGKYLAGVSAVCLSLGFLGMSGGYFPGGAAFAAEEGGGHSSGGHSTGGHSTGSHDDGHDIGDHDDGHTSGKKGPGYKGGKQPGVTSGGRGGHSLEDKVFHSEEPGEDSDRRGPQYGGGKTPGKPENAGDQRGDLFGDMYVILRDENGVPVLSPEGFVQPLDASGNPVPLDEEGHPVDETAVVEVELGRLNVSRAPARVLDNRLEEVVSVLNSATAVSRDAAGRLVLTVNGEEKTIDSPLENLALYRALVTEGSVSGLTVDASVLGDLAHIADGTRTGEDMALATSFLAGASDKTSPMNVDKLVYVNTVLGIGGDVPGADGRNYVDYSGFSYDRAAVYGGKSASVLIQQPDGTWTMQTIDIMDAVFGGANATVAPGAGAYSQATDDARAIINYIHEYEEPAHEVH